MEAFSDVVFGFALTLLVVSLEVPRTYAELHTMLRGFLPFAICFFFLFMVWREHYRFFRRFGLQDTATVHVNALLLFVVLFYVYPLKFLFTMVAGEMTGASRTAPFFNNPLQVRELMVLYGIGFAAIYGLLAVLNYLGWRRREALRLSAFEASLTQGYIAVTAIIGAVGLLSSVVACLLPAADAGYAGLTYLLIALHAGVGRRFTKRAHLLQVAERDPQAAE